MKKKIELPAFLEQTPEQVEAENKRQEALRQAFHSRVKRTPEEERIFRGHQTEVMMRANLETLEDEVKRGKRKDIELNPARARLAEGLATQGKYKEAAETTPVERDAKRFRAIHEAINRDDEELCECPPLETTLPGEREAISVSPFYVDSFVISEKHGGRLMPLVACNTPDCEFMNVRPLPPQLAEIVKAQGETERGEKAGRTDKDILRK